MPATDGPTSPDLVATWITSPEWQHAPDGPLPVLATAFTVQAAPGSARLTIAGLGVYDVALNGTRVSPDLLEPGYTDYAHHAEYTGYDVTDTLRVGENVLSIALGPGMYRSQAPDGRWTKVFTDYGDFGACAVLDWAGPGSAGRVVTDGSWHAALGPVVSSNWVGGEDYDAARELDLAPAAVRAWPPAVPARMPAGITLRAKTVPPLRIVEELAVDAVTEPAPGVFVIDFGVNFAGWAELELPAGAAVRLRPAELLHPDGTINEVTEGWGPVFHTVRAAGEPLRWHPRFAYNGLRYLEVTGLDGYRPTRATAGTARGLVIAANATPTGTFAASNQRLTDIHRIIRRAITSNMYSGFTDCPQREKLVYLEQLHLLFGILRWNYDSEALLENSLRLVREAQEPSGHLPLYVPEWDPFPDPWRGDPNWGLAIVFLPWQLHQAYGGTRALADNVDSAVRYVEYLCTSRVDGLVEYGLGDWDGQNFRHVPLVTTATLARALGVLARTCDVLGRPDGPRWRETRDEIIAVLRSRLVAADGTVGTGTLAELVIAVNCGVVPDADVPAAVDRIERQLVADGYYPAVGEIGMAALVDVLSRHDRHETLFHLTQVDEKPGYGYMLRHGATALTETWDGPTFGISQNHFMNGAIDDWFFGHVAGLQQQDGDVGFRRLRIRPQPCGDLTHARASYLTGTGEFASSWSVEDGTFTLDVTIPAGATCVVDLPDGTTRTAPPGTHTYKLPRPPIP